MLYENISLEGAIYFTKMLLKMVIITQRSEHTTTYTVYNCHNNWKR